MDDRCFIAGCSAEGVDERPVLLRNGLLLRVCTAHRDAIMQVLGEQAVAPAASGAR